MPEIFAPQMALFVARRAELALYREFIFPSVPARTGLLPVGIDDIKTNSTEIAPMAIDIAIQKAAVVVYDRRQSSRLPLDYVQSLRGQASIISVEAIHRLGPLPAVPNGASGQVLERPTEMSAWAEEFLEALVAEINALELRPTSTEIGQRLNVLTQQRKYADLLLTGLALLEHDLRRDDVTTFLPRDPSEGAMARLRKVFQLDYQTVIDAVSLRHGLLQNPKLEEELQDTGDQDTKKREENLERASVALADVVRRRFHVPQPTQDPR